MDNLPLGPCAYTAEWNTDLIIGEVGTGISLAFSPPLSGPTAHLGTLHITCFEPLADEYRLCVMGHEDSALLIVVDGNFNTHNAEGMAHRFNTDIPSWCGCYGPRGERGREYAAFMLLADPGDFESCGQDMPVETTAAGPSAWSLVKSLY